MWLFLFFSFFSIRAVAIFLLCLAHTSHLKNGICALFKKTLEKHEGPINARIHARMYASMEACMLCQKMDGWN